MTSSLWNVIFPRLKNVNNSGFNRYGDISTETSLLFEIPQWTHHNDQLKSAIYSYIQIICFKIKHPLQSYGQREVNQIGISDEFIRLEWSPIGHQHCLFLARLFEEYESYTTHPGVAVGVHVTLWLRFCMQVLKYYTQGLLWVESFFCHHFRHMEIKFATFKFQEPL